MARKSEQFTICLAVPVVIAIIFLAARPLFAHQMPAAEKALRNAFFAGQSTGVLATYFILAFVLGAFHALTPGHGKTVIAAYLIGSRGRVIDAIMLGTVTATTHTAGVIILGFILLLAFNQVVPPRLTPYLGIFSGMIIIFIGVYLFARRRKESHSHGHYSFGHHHDEHHHHSHLHGHHHEGHHHHVPEKRKTHFWSNIFVGISGGIIPCPTALVILFLAVSLKKIGLGLTLIICFSIGLASTLTLVGILFAKGSSLFENYYEQNRIIKKIPMIGAGVVVLLGIAIVLKSLMDLDFLM